MKLVEVDEQFAVLYELLKERTEAQSISHKNMPTWDDHVLFVKSDPYVIWYVIWNGDEFVGQIHINYVVYPKEAIREVGISIFNKYKGKGYATEALKMLMERHPGNLYANINPDNYPSKMFFTEKFGAKLIQQTYAL